MRFTYDLNGTGCLIIEASDDERAELRAMREERGGFGTREECDALERDLCNGGLQWIDPLETGDLTSAPMLGFYADDGETVWARWAFMDYALRSFLDDLVDTGRAVFVS